MQKILSRLAALAAFAQALSASAAVVSLPGSLDTYTASAPFQQLMQTLPNLPTPVSISDTFEFSLTAPASVSLAVQSYSGFAVGGGSPELDFSGLSLALSDAGHSFLAQAGSTDAYTRLFTGILQAGSYFADVKGTYTGPLFGMYRATFSAAPVPEPGTWALFGAGALLVGARVKRRRG